MASRFVRLVCLSAATTVLFAVFRFPEPLGLPRQPQEGAALASLPQPDAPARVQVERAFGQLPLYFVENQGQLDERVAYYIQGSDKTIYFTSQGVTFALTDRAQMANRKSADRQIGKSADQQIAIRRPPLRYPQPGEDSGVEAETTQRWTVKLDFVGANLDVRPVGQDPTEAVISYFKGAPDQWHTGLRTYSRIVYPDLWPGIDLVYYGTVNQLKYEFIVRPGADPAQIRLAYRGATGVALNSAGQLEVTTPMGGFRDDTPVAYQEIDGQRVAVDSAYQLANDAVMDDECEPTDSPLAMRPARFYGFSVGPYDPSRPLVLDPAVLVYCGYIGGSESDGGSDIAVDSAGNAYVMGTTRSTSTTFPVTVGPDPTYNRGDDDAFVAKVNAAGTGLVYCGYIGGSDLDFGSTIAVDGAGNAYVIGSTASAEGEGFPVTVGPDPTYNGGYYDAFVAKVNAAGTGLIYAGYIGGSDGDRGYGIAVDGAGSAYVTGITGSTEATFPVAIGPDLTYNGGSDAFVAKVRADGTGLVYAGYIGGSGADRGYRIAVDSAGNAYVTDYTTSTEATFPVTVGPDLTHNGGWDAFVAKVNAAGTGLVYCGYIGGSSDDYGWGDIAVDGAGNAYITGYTVSTGTTFPVTVGPSLTHNGGYFDAFVAKVNAAGTGLIYAGYIGGSGYDFGYGIAVDVAGNAYVTGSTYSNQATFPVTVGPDLTYNGGGYDAFVAKVRADGTGLIYAGYIGGLGDDYGWGIAVDRAGNAYVTGRTTSTETTFPVTVGPDLTCNGYEDAFVAKVSGDDGPEPGPAPHGSLTLLVAPGIPTSHPLAAIAYVQNTGAASQGFTLAMRLWQGSTVLSAQTFTLSLAAGAVGNRTADFGLRPAGRYRVEAMLSASGTTLATQSRDVMVTNSTASRIILDYAGDLQTAAQAELDDIAYIPSWALSDEIVSFSLDKIEDLAVGKFADFAAPIQDAGGIPRSTSNDAIAQIRDKLGRVRQYQQDLATAIRLFVRDSYRVTLPKGFDPLNPDLDFITDPILKDRIKNAIAGCLANLIRDRIVSPLWVNGPRSDVDGRHVAFESFVTSHAVVGEPPGLAGQVQHGRDHILNVAEGDAIVSLGPYPVLGHTLRYDLTLQEQENKRQQIDRAEDILKIAIAVLVVVGVVIVLLLIAGAISSAGVLAAVVAPIVWKIVKLLLITAKILAVATALLAVSMLFSVQVIAPHAPQYHDETLDAVEALIGSSGLAYMRSFDVNVQPGQARVTTRVDGPETGESRVLVETALYSVDGRIISLIWSPLRIQAGQQGTLSKEVPLAPGAYRAVTTLYAEGDVAVAEATPFDVPGPEVELALSLSQPRLSPGQPVQAHVSVTNTNPISDVNDLTLIVESTDGVNFDAWPVSLVAGGARQINYTFTPTTTGAYVLRAWLGIGLNTLAQEDAAYIVGTGSAVALNTRVSDVYAAGLTVTLPLTLTNIGDAPGEVTVTVQTMDRLRTGTIAFISTLMVTVPAGGTAFAQAPALPNAQPGLYSAWLDVNGVPYDTRDFAVSAADTLFGLLTPGNLYPTVGQSVPVTATVRDTDSTLTDATITVTVQSPTSTAMALPMTQVTTGTYRANYTPAISGTYPLELAVTRANYRGVGDRAFLVAGTPTLLIPTAEGQPQAGEIRFITVTVRSESGVPVPGATVALSGTEEILRGETDATGRVILQTFPPDGRSYVLTTDKMGYAGATTEVAVGWLRVYLPLVLRHS